MPSLLGPLTESRCGLELVRLHLSGERSRPPVAPVAGQPALLICGLLASDQSLSIMAGWLKKGGWAPKRAGIGLNVDCSETETQRLLTRLECAVEAAGQPAVIVGQSRGGLFARVLAVRRPDLVAGVVTLGSPIADPLGHAHPLLRGQIRMLASFGDRGMPGVIKPPAVTGARSLPRAPRAPRPAAKASGPTSSRRSPPTWTT